MPKTISHPYVLLGLVALFWGGNAVAGKLADGHVSPMLLNLFRWGLAALFLLPFAAPRLGRDWSAIRPRLPYLLMLGASGFSVFNALLYVALKYTSAINVMIEQSAMPLLVFLANFLLYRTRVGALQVLGFASTLVGIAVTAAHGDLATLLALDLNRGDALMLVAVAIYGVYTVALRSKPAIHWLSLIFVLCAGATLAAIPLAFAEWTSGRTVAPDLQGALIILYVAVLPSIFAQVFFIRGVEMIGANRAGVFINLVPIFGTGLAVALVGEALRPYHVAALFFVLGGIWLAERGSAPAAARG